MGRHHTSCKRRHVFGHSIRRKPRLCAHVGAASEQGRHGADGWHKWRHPRLHGNWHHRLIGIARGKRAHDRRRGWRCTVHDYHWRGCSCSEHQPPHLRHDCHGSGHDYAHSHKREISRVHRRDKSHSRNASRSNPSARMGCHDSQSVQSTSDGEGGGQFNDYRNWLQPACHNLHQLALCEYKCVLASK